MSTAISSPPQVAGYKRRLRNYLLDSRFQLKYAGLLVLVAVGISGVMGGGLYLSTRAVVGESSALVEESKKVSEVSRMNVQDLAGDSPELLAEFNREADAHDSAMAAQQASLIRRQKAMLESLVSGLALMVVVLGLFGIYLTHKVAGPVHKMKRLLKRVGEGNLHIDDRLRRRDELQDFFDAFTQMVSQLRQVEEGQLKEVENAIAELNRGAHAEATAALGRLRAAMKRAVEP